MIYRDIVLNHKGVSVKQNSTDYNRKDIFIACSDT